MVHTSLPNSSLQDPAKIVERLVDLRNLTGKLKIVSDCYEISPV